MRYTKSLTPVLQWRTNISNTKTYFPCLREFLTLSIDNHPSIRPVFLQLRVPGIYTQLAIVILIFAEFGAGEIDNGLCDSVVDLGYCAHDIGNDACVADQVRGGNCCGL